MHQKKYKGISVLLIGALLTGASLPALADDTVPQETIQTTAQEQKTPETPTPQTLELPIYANCYTTETSGEYRIVFTAMRNIPAFTAMQFRVSMTDATIGDAAFEEAILREGDSEDVVRGRNYATYQLTREPASSISAKTAFANLTLRASAAPTQETLSFSDAYLQTESGTVTITPLITLQEGPIIPTLTEKEQSAYDLLLALPDPNTISYYQENGALVSLSGYRTQLEAAQNAYSELNTTEKEHVNQVLAFYGQTTDVFQKTETLLTSMEQGKGLIEIASALSEVTTNNVLTHRYLIQVYDAVKPTLSVSNLAAEAKAKTELDAADTRVLDAKALLTTALESATQEDLVYACGDQLKDAQSFSAHTCYARYLEDIQTQITQVRTDVEEHYTGREENKKNLLSYLQSYETTIELIQNGVDDIPTMDLKEIIRGSSYSITFTRKKVMDNAIKASIRVIVTNASGAEIDRGEVDFPAEQKTVSLSFVALRGNYPADGVVTIHASYILDGASFPIASKEYSCVTLPQNPVGGIGNSRPGTGIGIGGGSGNNTQGGSTTGGTIFPSDQPTTNPNPPDTAPDNAPLFRDLTGYEWAKEAIEGLYYAGIVNGMEDGVYNPAGIVTREQFAKMVVQLFGVSTGGNLASNFVDVDTQAWYAPYLTAAMQAGYIQGQSDEYFGIGESIMRQDMAVILYRALGDRNSKAILSFSDLDAVAGYATDAIAELVGLGVLNGYEDGTFAPRGTATRAEAAKTIWGVYQILHP